MTHERKPGLLLLVHRIPFPPNKGDKIRSYNLLRHLLRDYRVYLGCFVDDPADQAHEAALRELCEDCCFVRIDPMRRKLASLRGLLSGAPLTLPFYASRKLQSWVDRVVEEQHIEAAVAFSSATAQFLMHERFAGLHKVMDFIDIDSDKWQQYAQRKRFPMSWLYRREGRSLLGYEAEVAHAFAASTFVSDDEASMFRQLVPAVADKVHAVPNGVDLEHFSADAALASPFDNTEARKLVFVGAMDYWPNVDAVTWFAREVLPIVQQTAASEFWIVGSNPSREVKALQGLPGVRVTGRVDDVRSYVKHADVCVAPLRVARGIQNKVLESMAMAKATVVTPQALEGIPAIPGEHLLRADDADGLAAHITSLFNNPESAARMGTKARELMESRFSWQAALSPFDTLLQAQSQQV